MDLVWFIVLPVAGLVLGWTIRWLYARFQLSASEQRAERVKQDAIKEAEAQKKEILLEAKDQLIRERNQQERENRERRSELQRYERRLTVKEETLDKRMATLDKQEQDFVAREQQITEKEANIATQEEKYRQELERISGLTAQEAKNLIVQNHQKPLSFSSFFVFLFFYLIHFLETLQLPMQTFRLFLWLHLSC